MAIQPRAGSYPLWMRNTNRELALSAISFPSVKPTTEFSWSVWVKPTAPRIPLQLIIHSHIGGSQIVIGHDGFNWYFYSRDQNIAFPSVLIAPVVIDAWTLICFAKSGVTTNIYMGNEDPLATQPWLTPVQITPVMGVDCTIDDDFDSFQLIANAAGAICGFKFWSVANSQAVFEAQSQTWHGDTGGVGVNPFWVSPLRVPGDISNTQVPYSGYGEVWNHGHAYSAPLGDPGTLIAVTDPAYMANTSACQAWLYPRITPHCFIDPGLTPLVPTFYKAPQFFEFADLGSIATEDHQIISIQYVGFSFPSTAEAAAFNESWGLFKDEGGVEVSDRIDPQYRFFPGTSLGNSVVNIPPGTTGIPKASTVYLWKFGAQFLWNPVTPQRDASQANLAYMFLYVTYLGYPTGNPGLSAEDMAGLFVIDRGGPSVDRYNRNVITRIPQPTIRTAYIGE